MGATRGSNMALFYEYQYLMTYLYVSNFKKFTNTSSDNLLLKIKRLKQFFLVSSNEILQKLLEELVYPQKWEFFIFSPPQAMR